MSWDVIGHSYAVELLSAQIRNDRVSHAYLFSGPAGVGRRTLALRFAQALNCTQPPQPGEPCLRCRTCTHIEAMQHPDLFVVRKPEDRTRILIDQIRELQRSLILSPYESNHRIALCLNFEEATEDAQNSFLKTLEEAPGKSILLVTAESPESLLPTIVSRCEVLRLHPLAIPVLEESLHAQRGIPPGEAKILAHAAQGCPGRALAWHQDPDAFDQYQESVRTALHLLESMLVERFQFAEQATKKGAGDLPALFRTWTSLWSDLLTLRTGAEVPLVNVEFADPLRKMAAKLDVHVIRDRVAQQQKAWRLLERYANPRLLVEVLLLDWPMCGTAIATGVS
jgi:DNA polymerase-3 subunit delta'